MLTPCSYQSYSSNYRAHYPEAGLSRYDRPDLMLTQLSARLDWEVILARTGRHSFHHAQPGRLYDMNNLPYIRMQKAVLTPEQMQGSLI